MRDSVIEQLKKSGIANLPLGDIRSAVSEAATNAVVHGFRNGEPGWMRVRVSLSPTEVEVTVEDNGSGMAPRADSPGLGLGMPLMATLADRVEVRTPAGGGTGMCMWFSRHALPSWDSTSAPVAARSGAATDRPHDEPDAAADKACGILSPP